MKTSLKVLAALALVASIWFGARYLLTPPKELLTYYTLTINGEITPQAFVEAREHLVGAATDLKKVVITSGGGNGPAALAIGMLIHRHNWDVEVGDICVSSCAIFIFPAGKKKYLNENSLLMFHGGPHQENMLEMVSSFDREVAKNGLPSAAVVLGQTGKEGHFSFTPGNSPAAEEVLDFLSMKKDSNAVERLGEFRAASDRFYQELGVNPVLGTYGQVGSYERLYKSYKYGGFIYRLDSLRRLGVSNIELKSGEWRPERNPAFSEAYEVTYP
jgi:hypothetical protein